MLQDHVYCTTMYTSQYKLQHLMYQLCWYTCTRIGSFKWQAEQKDSQGCHISHQLSWLTRSFSYPLDTKQSQSDATAQVGIHTKEDIISLFPDCFITLGKFQSEAYDIEVDPCVQSKTQDLCSFTIKQLSSSK